MKNKIAILLAAAGVICIAAGVGLVVKSQFEQNALEGQMDALRDIQEIEESTAQEVAGTTEASEAETGEGEVQESGAAENENAATKESETTSSTETEASTETAPEEKPLVENPYAEAFRQNSDMAAWIQIDGTQIDYPVVQTMEDENYYLYRGFDKKENKNGCLILDTDSSITEPLSTNLIIHGHNMKSGAMFGTLTDYENEEYGKEHKYIKLYTKECERNYEVISVFRSQVYKKSEDVFKFYKFFQADTQEEFDDWYTNIKELSAYDTGVTAEFGDRFLTLSTCVYHVKNGRLVVVAKEIEPGDSYLPVEE